MYNKTGTKAKINVKMACLGMIQKELLDMAGIPQNRMSEICDDTNNRPQTVAQRVALLSTLEGMIRQERATMKRLAISSMQRQGCQTSAEELAETVGVVMPEDMVNVITIEGKPFAFMDGRGKIIETLNK